MGLKGIPVDSANPVLPPVVKVAPTNLADDDFGDFSVASGVATLENIPGPAVSGAEASEAEAIAGTADDKVMTPRRAKVLNEKYDVRRAGVTVDGTDDGTNATKMAAAALVIASAGGGIGRIPVGSLRMDTGTVTAPYTRVVFEGDDPAGTVIDYYGSGAVFDLNGGAQCGLRKMRMQLNGVGTHGAILGHTSASAGWKYEMNEVDIFNFVTAGVHMANCEQTILRKVYVDGGGVGAVGFLANASRHTTPGAAGLDNELDKCRAYRCASYGFDLDFNQFMDVHGCQSLSNGALHQVRIGGSTFGFDIMGLDLEDVLGGATKSGLLLSGANHTVQALCFSLLKGLDLVALTGSLILPCRMSSVTTPLTIGSTCLDNTIVDPGNLGNIGSTANVHAASRTYWLGRGGAKLLAQTGTTYTLTMSDINKTVTLNNAVAITVTVPPNSTTAYPTGTEIDIAQLGAGQVTVAPGAGVTINGTPGLKLRAQYSRAKLIKTATDTWLLSGDIAA
jgi:hypothetical protein